MDAKGVQTTVPPSGDSVQGLGQFFTLIEPDVHCFLAKLRAGHRRRGSMLSDAAAPPIAVSIMIAWHLVADLEIGITLGVLACLLWPGKAA
jgi:hypothetical protein